MAAEHLLDEQRDAVGARQDVGDQRRRRIARRAGPRRRSPTARSSSGAISTTVASPSCCSIRTSSSASGDSEGRSAPTIVEAVDARVRDVADGLEAVGVGRVQVVGDQHRAVGGRAISSRSRCTTPRARAVGAGRDRGRRATTRPAIPGAPGRARGRTGVIGSVTGCARSHERNASVMTLNAAGVVIGARPDSTARPSSSANRAVSLSRRVLPMPPSPRSNVQVALPIRAWFTALRRRASSVSRPTTTDARVSSWSPRTRSVCCATTRGSTDVAARPMVHDEVARPAAALNRGALDGVRRRDGQSDDVGDRDRSPGRARRRALVAAAGCGGRRPRSSSALQAVSAAGGLTGLDSCRLRSRRCCSASSACTCTRRSTSSNTPTERRAGRSPSPRSSTAGAGAR